MTHQFKFTNTELDGLKIIEPFYAEDNRGIYIKSFEKEIFTAHGFPSNVHEICSTISSKGVLRGLHFLYKNPQAKLVRCTYGALFDVTIDLRANSPTYGKWHGELMTHKTMKMLFIPAGFAHGSLSLVDDTILSYHSDAPYLPDSDGGIRWNDPLFNVEWPFEEYGIKEPILSDKDKALPFLDGYTVKL